MKNNFILVATFLSMLSFAQVGINTNTPQATLEVAIDPNRDNGDGTAVGNPDYINGGMILGFPGKKNNYINGLTVAGIQQLQNQEILMRNKTTGQIDYMDRYALDYFPARPSHVQIAPGFVQEFPINENDHTILVRGEITLPTGSNYIGKTLVLIYDSQEEKPIKVLGPLKYNSELSSNLVEGIYLSRVNSGYTVQCDGTKWFVIGGFEQEDNHKVELVTLYEENTAKVNDNKILVKGNITLPAATVAGYELTLTYNGDGTSSYTVSGSIDDNGTIVSTYTLNKIDGTKAIKLQSNGTNWVVLAKR